MANEWGLYNYGLGLWGEQQDDLVLITGSQLNTNTGTLNIFAEGNVLLNNNLLNTNTGQVFISLDAEIDVNTNLLNVSLGDEFSTISVVFNLTGVTSSVLVNSIDYVGEPGGWGQFTWGFNEWGDLLNPNVDVTGLQLNTSVGNEEAFTDITVNISTNLLNVYLSSPFIIIGVLVEPNPLLLNTTVNSVFAGESIIVEVVTPANPTTWGQSTFGNYSWGQITGIQLELGEESVTGELNAIALVTTNLINTTVGLIDNIIDVDIIVNTNLLNTSIGTLSITGTGTVDLIGEQVNTNTGTISIFGEANVLLNTNLININVGDVFAFGLAVVNPIGLQLTASLENVDITANADVDVNTNLLNLSLGDESITANSDVDVIGQELNTTIGTLSITGDSNLTLNTNLLNTTVGLVDNIIDVIVEVNSPGQLPWGTTYWGYGTWGDIGGMDVEQGGEEVVVPSVEVDVIGQELITNTGILFVTGDANLNVNTNLLTTAVGSVDNIIDVNVLVSTNLLNTDTGTLSITGTGTVDLIGEQVNTNIGNVFITANADVDVNTNLLTTSLGNENIDNITIVDLTGNALTATVGTVFAGVSIIANVTGVTMTASTGRLYVSAWAVVNIGVTNNWTVVDIAA